MRVCETLSHELLSYVKSPARSHTPNLGKHDKTFHLEANMTSKESLEERVLKFFETTITA